MNKVIVKSLQPTRYVLGRCVTPAGVEFDLDELDDAQRADLDITEGIEIVSARAAAAAKTEAKAVVDAAKAEAQAAAAVAAEAAKADVVKAEAHAPAKKK